MLSELSLYVLYNKVYPSKINLLKKNGYSPTIHKCIDWEAAKMAE